MRSTLTLTRLFPIEYEMPTADAGVDIDGPRDHIVLSLQPRGVRLDNDGVYRHWITVNYKRWTLEHDGIGWRAQSNELNGRRYAEGHTLRLAADDGPRSSYVSALTACGRSGALHPAAGHHVRTGVGDRRGPARHGVVSVQARPGVTLTRSLNPHWWMAHCAK